MVNALMEYDAGQMVNYYSGYSAQAPNYNFRLEGSQGALKFEGIHMSKDSGMYSFEKPGNQFKKLNFNEIESSKPWSAFLTEWRSYLDGGKEPSFSASNNRNVLQLIEACETLHRLKKFIKL